MDIFPAVLIGGPPHSGKSVLAYSLSQALRRRGLQHYVIRAYPDGEGDWANEADQDVVRLIRRKGQGTAQWVDRICRDIAQRHLPLIVDMGGNPTLDQERIFDDCTQAIILSRDEPTRAAWLERCTQHGVPLLADLSSELHGANRLTEHDPIVHGIIAGLERSQVAQGPVFEALTDRLATLFDRDQTELHRYQVSHAPVELVIDLDRLALTLGVAHMGGQANWHPDDLPRLLDYLPSATSLGLYGRGPAWLYSAVACQTYPGEFSQFDPRLGWKPAVPLATQPAQLSSPTLGCTLHVQPGQIELACQSDPYLDYEDLKWCTAPSVPAMTGVILNGKLPLWVYTSLALTYRAAPWLAVYQPQLGGAVCVYSIDDRYPAGSVQRMPSNQG